MRGLYFAQLDSHLHRSLDFPAQPQQRALWTPSKKITKHIILLDTGFGGKRKFHLEFSGKLQNFLRPPFAPQVGQLQLLAYFKVLRFFPGSSGLIFSFLEGSSVGWWNLIIWCAPNWINRVPTCTHTWIPFVAEIRSTAKLPSQTEHGGLWRESVLFCLTYERYDDVRFVGKRGQWSELLLTANSSEWHLMLNFVNFICSRNWTKLTGVWQFDW